MTALQVLEVTWPAALIIGAAVAAIIAIGSQPEGEE